MKPVIDVSLAWHSNADPKQSAEFSGLICYSSERPKLGDKMKGDPKKILFDKGHMTPYEHFTMTWLIDGISVYDITLGFHLTFPFYDSCQRSGRYCKGMFDNPDYQRIAKYIYRYWPETTSQQMREIMDYIRYSTGIYLDKKPAADKVAYQMLKDSRPKIAQKNLEEQAPKSAQEQLRVFYQLIYPTCFAFSIDLVSLAVLYRTAWTPATRDVTERMVRIMQSRFPDLGIFNNLERREDDWAPQIISEPKVAKDPELSIDRITGGSEVTIPSPDELAPLDVMQFDPRFLNNHLTTVESTVKVSAITMGQDQRHRTVVRGTPTFTNDFYVPAVVHELGLEGEALEVLKQWNTVGGDMSPTLRAALAPYGSMLTYGKVADLNALAHEWGARSCKQAQTEIWQLVNMTQGVLRGDPLGTKLISLTDPKCRRTGVCAEPGRFCGRDLSREVRESDNFSTHRLI